MAAVEGDDEVGIQPFGQNSDRRIGAAEGKVGVLLDERGDAGPVVGDGCFDFDRYEALKKAGFVYWAEAGLDEVAHLSDHKRGDDQLEPGVLQQLKAAPVIVVRSVDSRV